MKRQRNRFLRADKAKAKEQGFPALLSFSRPYGRATIGM
nr:hypothetical protein [uncultured bacterium]